MKVIFKCRSISVIRVAQLLILINYFSYKFKTKRRTPLFICVRMNLMDPVCDVTEACIRPDEERRVRSRGPRLIPKNDPDACHHNHTPRRGSQLYSEIS